MCVREKETENRECAIERVGTESKREKVRWRESASERGCPSSCVGDHGPADPQKALRGGIPCSFLEPSARYWSHFVGIYRQKLTIF